MIYDIIIVGGGPCGIATIVEARLSGFKNLLLIEKGDNHSQTIRKFYKDNKRVDKYYKNSSIETIGNISFDAGSKESTLNYFDKLLDEDEIDTIFNAEVEKITKEDGIFRVFTANAGFEAKNVVIAIGKMGRPNKPDYKIPPSLLSVVNFNLDSCSNGEEIIVIGGGNSAAEYAIELSKTNKITLSYRKPEFTRLNDINYKEIFGCAKNGDIELKLGLDIKELENENGRVKVIFADNSSQCFDRVIYAIGGTMPVDFLQKCSIKLDDKKQPILDENNMSENGIYVGGDVMMKNGGSIVMALNHASKIVSNIAAKG